MMFNTNPMEHPLFTKYRRTDPNTSKQAAESIYSSLPKIQKEVLLYAIGQDFGFTDEEMNEHFQTYKSTYRSRRAELVNKGLIVDSGLVRNKMTVWILKEYV